MCNISLIVSIMLKYLCLLYQNILHKMGILIMYKVVDDNLRKNIRRQENKYLIYT